MITNEGKTNSNHHWEFTEVLPHRNPIFCTAGAFRILLILRFGIGKESMPEFSGAEL